MCAHIKARDEFYMLNMDDRAKEAMDEANKISARLIKIRKENGEDKDNSSSS